MSNADTGASSHLEAEIREQPDALRRFTEAESTHIDELTRGLRDRDDIAMVMIAARGSSDNAARYAQYMFAVCNRLPVALAAPSLFTRYRLPPRLDHALVLAISQSGRSPDVVEVLTEARRQGRPTVAITNEVDSPLARAGEHVIGLHAGEERSVAATKTFMTSVAAVGLLAAGLANDPRRRTGLLHGVEAVSDTIGQTVGQRVVPDWMARARSCAVVGRGFNYATACEIALKIKELTGIAAQAYSSADLLHGPIAAVGQELPVILVAPSGQVHADVAGLVQPLRERGARIAAISDDADLLAAADLALAIPGGVDEAASPLTAVVPGQVLAWRLAQRLGVDVDRPVGLRKVTETH